MQTKGLLIRKYFVNLNCEVSSCKQGPLLALPQTPGGEVHSVSSAVTDTLGERKKNIFKVLTDRAMASQASVLLKCILFFL